MTETHLEPDDFEADDERRVTVEACRELRDSDIPLIALEIRSVADSALMCGPCADDSDETAGLEQPATPARTSSRRDLRSVARIPATWPTESAHDVGTPFFSADGAGTRGAGRRVPQPVTEEEHFQALRPVLATNTRTTPPTGRPGGAGPFSAARYATPPASSSTFSPLTSTVSVRIECKGGDKPATAGLRRSDNIWKVLGQTLTLYNWNRANPHDRVRFLVVTVAQPADSEPLAEPLRVAEAEGQLTIVVVPMTERAL